MTDHNAAAALREIVLQRTEQAQMEFLTLPQAQASDDRLADLLRTVIQTAQDALEYLEPPIPLIVTDRLIAGYAQTEHEAQQNPHITTQSDYVDVVHTRFADLLRAEGYSWRTWMRQLDYLEAHHLVAPRPQEDTPR